ncbi:MAG TPA: CDP-alcohol phosphatidyltransferase family protein [Alphaproteobacteria bacterium]|nr:CDP-alcohol phosphatidyltransferase family protein [Alphaproteobacteria bacterium]
MSNASWSHRLMRPLVRPLIGSPVTPNHLTTLRLITALAACAAFAMGEYRWDIWGGLLWTLSALLDRADGELARLGGLSSAAGHLFDYMADLAANSLFFVAIAIGLADRYPLDGATIPIGILAGGSIALASILSEQLERRDGTGRRAYEGLAGFDFDDLLYLFGPIAWLHGLLPLLIGAGIGAPAFAALTGWRLRRMARRRPA